MKSLYFRIYLTLVALLMAFAFGATWLFQRQMEHERGTADAAANERMIAMGTLIHHALPAASAPREQQAAAIAEWGQRLRMAIALQDDKGQRIGASELFKRREDEPLSRQVLLSLDDGRSLVMMRAWRPQPGVLPMPGSGPQHLQRRELQGGQPPQQQQPAFQQPLQLWGMPWLGQLPSGEALATVLVLLFVGVAAGAYPVVRRLTRRLEMLKTGVESFGAGNLAQRVDDRGRDEVAAVARSFNDAAGRIESLLRSNKALLANASHELRSPLARLKMAFAMLDETPPEGRAHLAAEIDTNIAELDALVEEVLLASRLEAGSSAAPELVDVVGLAVEEGARVGAELESSQADLTVLGEERLLRRALRNLLENARRYGGDDVQVSVGRVNAAGGDQIELRVLDRGPGVPAPMRERIFEAFFRLPGHAEQAGGVGLGLSLVKQIAERHGGTARCEARPGGGSVFVLSFPAVVLGSGGVASA
ncbi:ATP-binding protein [Burkholderiaceae bacterium UC74_6]